MLKRPLSLILALVMVFSMLPVQALAEDVPETEIMTEPATEPATEPVTEPATEPVTEPETEPVTEPATEPVTEPETEPETEAPTEPEATEETKPVCTGLADCVAENHEDTCEKKIADDKAAADRAAADEVAALIADLPTLEQLQAMSFEEQVPYYNQVQSAYGAYCALTADQQALLPPAEDVFKPYFDYFNSLTAEVATSGTCGENLTWIFDENSGTLTISGTGRMADFDYEYSSLPWYAVYEEIKQVVIEDGVTYLGKCAFYGCEAMTSVSLPNTLTEIGESAFEFAEALEAVDIPDSVTAIGPAAFYACNGLKSIEIGDNVVSLGDGAFIMCLNLENVILGTGISAIGAETFWNCGALNEIVIPANVKSIESGAFAFGVLNTITFEGDAPTIAMDAFEGVTATAYYPFGNSTWTDEVLVDYGGELDWVPADSARGTCGKNLTWTLTSDGTLTISGTGEMTYCSTYPWWSYKDTISKVVLNSGVTSISNLAFSNYTALTEVIIPNTVTTIGANAFYDCTALTAVTIPASVTSYGQSVFGYVGYSDTIAPTFEGTVEQWLNANGNGRVVCSDGVITDAGNASAGSSTDANWSFYNGTLYINGSGAMPIYQSHTGSWIVTGWADLSDQITKVVVMDGITAISGFRDLTNLCSVELSATVETIYPFAFTKSGLASIVIPQTVTDISGAFYDCSALTQITFEHSNADSLTIDSSTFSIPNASSKVNTVVRVPSQRNINSTIVEYFANQDSRTVKWESSGTTFITAIEISSELDTLQQELGMPIQLSAAVLPADATSEVIWTISDPEMGLLSIDGDNATFAGYKTGAVTVRCASADDETVYAEIELTVLEPTGELTALTALRVAGEFPNEIELGVPAQMMVEFEPANASARDVTWELDDGTGSATIDENGIVTPLTPGTVIVTATSKENPDLFATCTVEILRYVDDITILLDGKENVSAIGVGDSIRLSALIAPTDAKYQNYDIVWTLSGKGGSSVGEVGTITAEQLQIREGAGTAYASAGSYKKGDVVVVLEQQTVSGTTWGRTNRGWISMSYVDLTGSTGGSAGVASLTKKQSYYYDDNGSSHSYYIYYLNGVSAGAVTLTATSPDSRGCFASIDVYVVGQEQAYAVSGGNIYYNTTTGVITGADDTVTEAVIPSRIGNTTITGIAPEAFSTGGYSNANTNLTYVKLPDTVTFIGDRAFSRCTNLATLKLGNGLTTIGENAFYYCGSITNLTIPDSVTSIGKEAFYGLGNLKNLTISGELNTGSWLTIGDPLNTLILTGTYVRSIHYHVDYVNDYWAKGSRNAKNVIIRDSITYIDDYAFEHCDYIESISVGSGVTSIGDYAFQSCYSLTTVNLPEGLQSIGEYAFSNCDSLTTVNLPEGLQSIGDYAFHYCDSLTTVNLPDSLQTIGKYAFGECYKLQMIDLSAVPDVIMQKETKLNNLATVPSILVSATGGKTELYWRTETVEGEVDAYDIAAVYGHGNSNDWYLHAQSTGRVLLVCVDEYTGARGSKEISIETGIELRGVPGYLTGGKNATVIAYRMPDNTLESVSWELRTGAEYATLSTTYGSSVNVTAKTVDRPVQVQLAAIPNGGDTRTADIWILPETTGISLFEGAADGETGDQVLVGQTGTTVQTVDVDMFVSNTYSLSAKMEPAGALDEVTWKSSDTKIATVDNGTITMKKTGTVTITATAKDGSGKSASVKLKVSYLDTAPKLTATAEVPTNGLQGGFSTTMLVYGSDKENALHPSNLIFTIPDSQQDIATVDDSGVITAGNKPGTVTVTAAIDGDPLNRKVSLKVKVIATQTESLKLISEADGEEQTVYLDKRDLRTAYTFTVQPEAVNVLGGKSQTGLKWTTTDSRIATVKANADGSATVTVKANTDGICIINAVTTDYAKVESDLTVVVQDFAPRLESTSLTMNTYLENGISVPMLESYDNSITDVTLHEYDSASRTYLDAESGRLKASFDDSMLTIDTVDEGIIEKNGTIKLQLRAATEKGVYTYNISVKVANTLPSITVKQPVKFNLHIAQPAKLTFTAKNAVISDVVLDPDTSEDFQQEDFDQETGLLTLAAPNDYIFGSKVDSKVEVVIELTGYRVSVRKAVTVGTTAAKPSVTVKQSEKLNLFYTDSEVELLVSVKDMVISHVEFDDTSTASFYEVSSFDPATGLMTIGLTDAYVDKEVKLDTSAKLLVHPEGGGNPIAKTFTISTTTVKPSLALTSASSIINTAIDTYDRSTVFSIYNKSTGEILQLDNYDVSVQAAFAETPVLEGDSVKLTLAGTSGGTATVKVQHHNWAQEIELTHKVTVQTVLPVPVLGSNTLKINRLFPEITAQTTVKLNQSNHQIDEEGISFESTGKTQAIRNEAGKISLRYQDGVITAAIDEDNLPKNGTYEFRYTVLLADGVTYLPAKTIKVTIASAAPAVSISAKGALDTMDPNSSIIYTVNKLTNIPGIINDVTLEGEDAEKFSVVLGEVGSKPVAVLTMASQAELATNKTYKLKLVFEVKTETEDGIVTHEVATNISFKVKQSALKFASVPVVKLYQFRNRISCTVELSAPATASLAEISLNSKTSSAFLRAMGGGTVEVVPAGDRSAKVYFEIAKPGYLLYGKSYTVYLDVTPANNATNVKPAQVKVTIKTYK